MANIDLKAQFWARPAVVTAAYRRLVEAEVGASLEEALVAAATEEHICVCSKCGDIFSAPTTTAGPSYCSGCSHTRPAMIPPPKRRDRRKED